MTASSLRQLLRDHTAPLHRELDARVGMFASADAYRHYLAGTWLFRTAVEAALPVAADWSPLRLRPAIDADLADLGMDPPAPHLHGWRAADPGERLGACYVLEGSAVGARMMAVAAQSLGFSGSFGARHLDLQAQDKRRWPQFIALLDSAPAKDAASALAGAEATFRLALSSYLEPARA